MCGIAGWLGPCELPQDPHDVIANMLSRIAHRGPDGRGTAALANGAGMLGHVRLAIIDPTGGSQPIWSQDGRSVLVFNGEIFNYRELRDRMSSAAIAWRTQSDSEVLLELLRREGPDALQWLRGMYAFAYWDGARAEAVLARDPSGIKPLFIREAGATLWFASEAKAFPATAQWRPTLDTEQLHLLLNLRYPADGAGLMQGVSQVSPGQCLVWSRSGVQRTSRSTAAVSVNNDSIRDSVEDSVRAHMVADVPVATYLSGGIDSGIVTCLAARMSQNGIRTYTIDAGDDPREAQNAAASARSFHVPNTAAALAEAGPDAISWLVWHLEVPKVNALQSAAVAQLASRHVKVCLSGLGSDELFLGYRAHHHLALATKFGAGLGPLANPAGQVLAAMLGASGTFGEPWRAARMLAESGDTPAVYALLRNVWDGALPRTSIYGPRMLDQPLMDAREWIRARWPVDSSAVVAMAGFEWKHKMVDDLLWQEDRTSMAFGLEVRVPFVDERLRTAMNPRLHEFARQPGTKRALKESFRGDLPDALLNRPKSGFQLDIARHVDSLFGVMFDEWLSPEAVARHGLFNPAFVARLRSLDRARGNRWHFFMLLLMAQTHRWVELFETDATARPAQPMFLREAA
jgi:asparagine synthase (glutamine-hydrolysing)